ncbi:MAG: hypothetical protein IPL63_17205 [Saprospiraceae bacterium]|nr:hypothetical protein [Saprospiraceae bacterium]MBK6566305.1 hypothetical protein [Saprospiraceae bacterium]MBK6783311.1 hypothetical protein [Saprospiraceae bacterium]MBK8081146.1 hypothetical protein [Saprospiraceae bacterium]MBK8372850.1 hypothetical protein [Saprospiraceae bacterium]
MKTLNVSTIKKLKNGEFLQIMKNTIELCEKSNPAALGLEIRLDDLRKAVAELEEVFQVAKGHDLTQLIDAADEKRMNVMRAIKNALKSLELGDFDAKTSATLLKNNYENHANNMVKLSVPQKTASLDALRKDWTEDPDLKVAMESLGLTVWMDRLEKTNSQCNDIYLKRIETTKQSGKISEKRYVIKSLFDDMIRDVEAHIRLNENKEGYVTFLQQINVLLSRFTFIIKARNAERKKTEVDDTSGEEIL